MAGPALLPGELIRGETKREEAWDPALLFSLLTSQLNTNTVQTETVPTPTAASSGLLFFSFSFSFSVSTGHPVRCKTGVTKPLFLSIFYLPTT